jgi:hypothetical protein
MDIDLETLKQCHEHLRETDKKRDQLAGLFAVIAGLVFANYSPLPDPAKSLLLVALSVIGAVVILIVIQYRRWHIAYVHCAQALDIFIRLRASSPTTSIADARNALLRNKYRSSVFSRFNPFDSAEAGIFYALTIVCFIPLQVVVSTSTAPSLPRLFLVSPILNFALFVLPFVAIAHFVFRRADKADPFREWILSGMAALPESPPSPPSTDTSGPAPIANAA